MVQGVYSGTLVGGLGGCTAYSQQIKCFSFSLYHLTYCSYHHHHKPCSSHLFSHYFYHLFSHHCKLCNTCHLVGHFQALPRAASAISLFTGRPTLLVVTGQDGGRTSALWGGPLPRLYGGRRRLTCLGRVWGDSFLPVPLYHLPPVHRLII